MADPKLNLQRNLQPKDDQGIVQFPRRAASARRQDSDIEYDQEVQEFVEEQEERADSVRSRQAAQQADKKPDVKYRIGLVSGFGLIFLAMMFDVFEIVLDLMSGGVAGFVKDFIQLPLFTLIFWVLDAPFWKGNKHVQKIATIITTNLIAWVPVLSTIMPEVTIGVVSVIFFTCTEDRVKERVARLKGANITRLKRGRGKNQQDKAA